MQIKLENILIIVIMIIGLYLFMNNCRYNRSYFTIGNYTKCHGVSEISCSSLNYCNWDNDKCHVINCSIYNDHREACINEEKCIALPWNDGWRCTTAVDDAIGSSDEEGDL